MAKQYRMTPLRRAVNVITSFLARRGKGPAYELTTVGRKSGRSRTVPVTPVDMNGRRYLVSPYGQVGWVHNIRAAGSAVLGRGGVSEPITVTEIEGEEAGAVLQRYYRDLKRIVGPFFDLPPNPTLDDFVAAVGEHPVFRIDG